MCIRDSGMRGLWCTGELKKLRLCRGGASGYEGSHRGQEIMLRRLSDWLSIIMLRGKNFDGRSTAARSGFGRIYVMMSAWTHGDGGIRYTH